MDAVNILAASENIGSSMKTVLIIGGSGFIGANIAEYFCKRNYKVINYGRSVSPVSHENLINIFGNINDAASVESVFRDNKIDYVIHSMTTFSSMDEFDSCQDVVSLNLSSLIDLVKIMCKYKVNNMVYISSGGAIYGCSDEPLQEEDHITPVSFYGWLKEVSERYLSFVARTEEHFKYIVIRPSNVYGKYQKINRIIGVALKNAILGEPVNIYGNLNICKDYVHVNDLTESIEGLMTEGQWNEVYNLGTGKGTSLLEIFQCVEKVTGKKVIYHLHEKKTGDVLFNVLDNSKLTSAIGKHSFLTIEQGVNDMHNYVKKIIGQV